MSLLGQWHDFVRCAVSPNRVRTARERLNTTDAGSDCVVVRLDDITKSGETFEDMDVTATGDVTIWTNANVWTLRRSARLEKLFFVSRNPQAPDYHVGVIGEWRDFVLADHFGDINTAEERTTASSSSRATPHRRQVTINELVGPDDAFEAMFVGGTGAIIVWTAKTIWFTCNDGGDEALGRVSRHPTPNP